MNETSKTSKMSKVLNTMGGRDRVPSDKLARNPAGRAASIQLIPAMQSDARRHETVTDIVDDLRWRGLIAVSTDEDALRKAFADGPVTFYCGFDPTAPSLHVGSLVQILTMRRIQQAGNKPFGLVGGATGLIGDPKPSAERILNDPEVVAGWVTRLRGQIERFLDFEGPNAARMVNNLDWTSGLSAINFLRDVGKHFRVNNMIAKEAVARRLDSEAGISYTEFSYQVLQGMDYLQLYRRHGCTLQTGGSDQWGNLTAGTDLVRKTEGVSVHALGTPLITKADGTKFGKTEGGTIWLDPELTTPYAFYQFWLNADDRDVSQYLRFFSFRSHEEIEELERLTQERPQARTAQRALAEELTMMLHGADQCTAVIAASRALFGQGELAGLDEATLAAALSELPRAKVSELVPVVDLLAETGLASSKSAARRTIKEGGAYVNNTKVVGEDAVPSQSDLLHGRWLVLRRGKRNLAAVQVIPG
jgi:tyrosyl-tRNA synthetase